MRTQAPEPIARVVDRLGRRSARGRLPLVCIGGRVLDVLPRGAQPIAEELLVPELHPEIRELVLVRQDLEELVPYSRPLLERTDLGRDFFVGDDSSRALVRVGTGGHAHPDLELHLDGPPLVHPESDPEDEVTRTIYVRALRTGDPVYVLGRPTLERDEDHAGYRDAPPALCFSPTEPMHLYDELAFRQWSAWSHLSWLRKLSVLLRNR